MTRHKLYLIKLGISGDDDLEDFNRNEQDDYLDDFDKEGFPYDENTLERDRFNEDDLKEADAEARQNQE